MKKASLFIITGYLGSGKTTLLKNIAENSEKKIALLINEFGEIAIDTKIIKGKNVDMTELTGGCVCCSLTGEFGEAIKEIIENANPEILIVETTGVAEPDAIVLDAEKFESVKLESIITIVDCDSIIRFPSIGHTARLQIEVANILLLNKIDLITKEQLIEVRKIIRKLNKKAVIFTTERCNINVDMLFGLNIEKLKKEAYNKGHKIDVEYFEYKKESIVSKSKLENFLNKLPENVFRLKGFINIEDNTHILNYVAGRYDLELTEKRSNELVFIGKNVKKLEKYIVKKIDECKM